MAVRRTTNAMGTIKTVDSLVTWYKRELDKENQYYINTNTIITYYYYTIIMNSGVNLIKQNFSWWSYPSS